MTIEQEIHQLFRQVARDMDSAAKEVALERLSPVLSKPNINKDAIRDVLKAELTRSFFEDRHAKKTSSQKPLFDFELSESMCRILDEAFPRQGFSGPGILEPMETQATDEARTHMANHGFVMMPHRLNQSACDQIVQSLEDIEFRVKASGDLVKGYHSKNVNRINGNTCWVSDQQKILEIPQVQQLASDPTILNLVQDYLGCTPIHDQTNCWWTINHRTNQRTMKSDAQQFHQDKDYIRFVKVFVYLNDVTDENGPHTYISGSARDYAQHVPANYSITQRVDDEFLEGQYAADRFVTMSGKQGTIVLEDTSGFHKGTPVRNGHRLMLQLEYCCSLYFTPGISFSYEGLSPEYVEFARQHPRMFMNYDNDRYLRYITHKRKQSSTSATRVKRKIRQFGNYIERIGANYGLRKSA